MVFMPIIKREWTMYNQITIPEMEQDIDTISDILSVTPNHSYENEFFASVIRGWFTAF